MSCSRRPSSSSPAAMSVHLIGPTQNTRRRMYDIYHLFMIFKRKRKRACEYGRAGKWDLRVDGRARTRPVRLWYVADVRSTHTPVRSRACTAGVHRTRERTRDALACSVCGGWLTAALMITSGRQNRSGMIAYAYITLLLHADAVHTRMRVFFIYVAKRSTAGTSENETGRWSNTRPPTHAGCVSTTASGAKNIEYDFHFLSLRFKSENVRWRILFTSDFEWAHRIFPMSFHQDAFFYGRQSMVLSLYDSGELHRTKNLSSFVTRNISTFHSDKQWYVKKKKKKLIQLPVSQWYGHLLSSRKEISHGKMKISNYRLFLLISSVLSNYVIDHNFIIRPRNLSSYDCSHQLISFQNNITVI